MGWQWLASLQAVVELIGSLIPRRVKIPPTHRGIRLRNMTKVSVLQPGLYWFWPFMSSVSLHLVAVRPAALASQYVMTQDGKPMWVDASVLYSVGDDDESVLKAFLETAIVEEVAGTLAMAALGELIEKTTFVQLFDRDRFSKNFRDSLRIKFAEYGLKVIGGNIETLATGRPLLILGNGR